MEKLFTTFEVARICQVSPASVSRWIRDGKLVSSVTAGGHHRVGCEALRIFLKALRLPVPPELNPVKIKKVLIMDRDARVRKMVRLYLERSFEISVEEAADGFEAGWKAHAMKLHLMILDLSAFGGCPDGNAVLFLKKLAAGGETEVILTGTPKEMNEFKKRLPCKVTALVTKPFDTSLLKQKIKECLEPDSGGRRHAKAG